MRQRQRTLAVREGLFPGKSAVVFKPRAADTIREVTTLIPSRVTHSGLLVAEVAVERDIHFECQLRRGADCLLRASLRRGQVDAIGEAAINGGSTVCKPEGCSSLYDPAPYAPRISFRQPPIEASD